jgi:energy-converting hydrogenase A subunit R
MSVRRVFISDCEGPISKNDNAFELTAHFVPDGDKLFSIISKYDDVLADIVKRPGYNAGDTLKLILPFLKAYDVTDQQMREFSSQNLLLIAGTKETLKHIMSISDTFIVSTSYEHYIHALCDFVGFPSANTYCTGLTLDKFSLTEEEKTKLQSIAKEIAAMQMITIPRGAPVVSDFSSRDQATFQRLEQIFWKEIPAMQIGQVINEVTTVGGEQKARAIREILRKTGATYLDVMYVGDSITDVQAFQEVRRNYGLTVSFNGNDYAVINAEVSVMSENNLVTAVLADVFLKHGKAEVRKLVENWTPETLAEGLADAALVKRLFELYPVALPKVQIVTSANMESLSAKSSEFRKQVRGEAVGKLG